MNSFNNKKNTLNVTVSEHQTEDLWFESMRSLLEVLTFLLRVFRPQRHLANLLHTSNNLFFKKGLSLKDFNADKNLSSKVVK